MGVWGRAPNGVQEQNPWSEGQAKPPETEALLAFGRSMKAAHLSTFLQFEKAKKSDIYVTFTKNHGWLRNWGLEQKWGPVPPLSPAMA